MSVWHGPPRVASGSLSFGSSPMFQGRIRSFAFASGSWSSPEDRTGQIVRDSDVPDVWLVRESTGHEHVLVNERNEERQLDEDSFWPYGTWRKVAG